MHRRLIVVALTIATLIASITLVVSFTPPAAAHGLRVPICFVARSQPTVERTMAVAPQLVDRIIRTSLSYNGMCASYGESATVGNGQVRAFTQSRGRVPTAIGLSMRTASLTGLPVHPPTGGLWCYDANGDGQVDDHMECTGGYEYPLRLSGSFKSTVDTPYQYVLLNWNPFGHMPTGVYDVAHFDVHFYVTPNKERLAIRPGPCGLLVNCEDWEIGKQPVPARYLAPDYSDFGAVEPGMGNHLIDLTGPELNGQPFTHTFIYGSYGGKVTFYEPMVAHSWLTALAAGSATGGCFPLKLPQAWQKSGWYPTKYCVRYRDNRKELTTTMEGFVYRVAR